MQLENHEGGKKYVSVLADGKFHKNVPEGTEGAVVRTYEDKDKNEHTKTELVFDSVSGVITKISFEDGKLGKNLLIEIDGDGVIQLSTTSNFGENLMKKIPNIDFSEAVKLVPFSFEDGGKTRKGMTVYQNETKVESHYYDSEKKENINGIPEVDGDTSKFDSDDWKMHFMKVRKFLVGEVEKVISNNGWSF